MAKDVDQKIIRRSIRIAFRSIGLVALMGALVAVSDYAQFVGQIKRVEQTEFIQPKPSDADAVVVLTGGANRISTGVKLLKQNHGRRLLISGVSAQTTRSDLGKVLDDSAMMYGCCIDLDRKALDTRGNAIHTADWVELHNFRKILLVTSSYHMPRSLMLLNERMPDVEVIAVPIQPPSWENRGFWSLLASPVVLREYAKYRVAKFGFEPSVRRITSAFLSSPQKARS